MPGLDSENSDAKKDKERKLQEFGTGRFGIDVLGCLGMLVVGFWDAGRCRKVWGKMMEVGGVKL